MLLISNTHSFIHTYTYIHILTTLLMFMTDGSVYTGEWKEGKYHGLGGMSAATAASARSGLLLCFGPF